jgi:Caspase domain/Agenet domain
MGETYPLTRQIKNSMEWQPENTWLFAIGLLEWEDGETFAPFPDAVANRFDAQLVDFFRESGVPEEQIVYLQDAKATLENIQASFVEFLSNTDENSFLIFYFTGHGGRNAETGEHFFYNYDANAEDEETFWSVSSIFDGIEENFSGSQALLMADCCYSGGLIDEVKCRDTEISYACISSAYAHNISTEAWTFTESLLKGLKGDPTVDLDGDRLISLYDFARFAELEVAFIENQKSMFVTTNDFDPQMQLSIVQGEANVHVGRRVEAEYDGVWYKVKILDSNDNDELLVRYPDASEEWVTDDRIRTYEPQMYEIGAAVKALDENDEWYPATVKKAWYGLHYISYDDFDETWDEWVGSDRIHPINS